MVSRLALFGAISCVAFLLIILFIQKYCNYAFNEDDLVVHKNSRGNGLKSMIRCDREAMSCVFTNLRYVNGSFVAVLEEGHNDDSHLAWTGLFMHEGIGSPSNYFYIDTWSMMSDVRQDKRVLRGYKRLRAEMRLYPDRKFTPIYLASDSVDTDVDSLQSIKGVTVFGSILWPNNFFRKFYFLAASIATCQEWLGVGLCGRGNVSYILSDVRSGNIIDLHINLIELHDYSLFQVAIFGISKNALLPELEILTADLRHLPLVKSAYKQVSLYIPPNTRCPIVKRVLVYRKGGKRSITNWQQVVREFNLTPIILEDYPLETQICILSNAELLVSMHGAALGHLFFVKDTRRKPLRVVEIFPCRFKKSIYRNLAAVMGASAVEYRWWQANHDCPNDHYISPLEDVDWTNQSSKDKFRNQSVHVCVEEFKEIIDFEDTSDTNYLLYMPWEQYNNQLISLRCACGMALLLDRTLVVPDIGYRKQNIASSERQVYSPLDFRWNPITRYFNLSLPCKTVPASAYFGSVREIDRIYYRRLGAKFNTRVQSEVYYYYIAGLFFSHHRSLAYNMPVYLNSTGVMEHLGKYRGDLKHLALGNVFWMYSFDGPLEYPLRGYVDLMDRPDYQSIAAGLKFHPRLYERARMSLASSQFQFGVVHWRRGDYKDKCTQEIYPESCYPSIASLIDRIGMIDASGDLRWMIISNYDTQIIDYILRKRGYRVYKVRKYDDLDPIEQAIVEQIIAAEANVFLGNFYSSFSRTITDMRRLNGRRSEFI